MKKIILLILLSVFSINAQTLNNPTFGTLTVKSSPTVISPNYLVTQGMDGKYGKIEPVNLPFQKALAYSTDFYDVVSQNPSTLELEKRTIKPESTRLALSNTGIVAWGDSFTAGAGGSGNTYPLSLNNLSGFAVLDKGVGGENSTQIKDRMIADVANYSKSVIIWAGRNNYSSPTTVKADIATMIAALGHDRYFVVSILNGDYATEYQGQTGYNTIVTLNNDLKALYGDKFIPLREYLVSLHDNTTQGLLDFSRDIVPYNLRSDQLHLTSAGYTIVAQFINQRLNNMFNKKGEYLQAKDFKYYRDLFWPESINVASDVIFNASGVKRWAMFKEGTESGGTSGGNFVLKSYLDSGTLNSGVMNIIRFNSHMIYKHGTTGAIDRGYLFDVNGSFASETLSIISPLAETTEQPLLTWNSTTKGVRTIPYNSFAPNMLTGYVSGAGTVSSTDTVLQAIQKLNGNDRPYKSYTFYISQSGTNNPTITTLENQLSLSGIWTRTGAGAYQVTLSTAIDASKTISPQHSTICTREFFGGKYQLYARALSSTVLQILVKSEDGGTDLDGMILNKPIEFRVYN